MMPTRKSICASWHPCKRQARPYNHHVEPFHYGEGSFWEVVALLNDVCSNPANGHHFAPRPRPKSATTGHAVRSIGSDIIRPLEQWEYQDRLHRPRPHVRELEAVPDCEPSQAGRTETAPSPRGMRASRGSGSAPAKACARLSTSRRIVGLIVESRRANWLLCTRTGNCHSP